MKIKIKDDYYDTEKIPKYNMLKAKLSVLFSENKQEFDYIGIIHKGKLGILVCGTDNKSVRDFAKFYPISEINHYFDQHIHRIRLDRERQRIGT